MLLTLAEIADMVLMVGIIGFLFKDVLRAPASRPHDTDALVAQYRKKRRVTWDDFWWACALVAPGILLHELAHKLTAIAFGQAATFHAACSVSYIGTGGFFGGACLLQVLMIALKLIGIPFLVFIPGYVSFSAGVAPLAAALIAFAGPAIHLLFWGGCRWYLHDAKRTHKLSMRRAMFFAFTARINGFLFVFNILPIPGFDGFQVLRSLIAAAAG